MRNESRNVKENIPEKQESESKLVISRQNLIVEQSKDKELLDLFKIALTPLEAEKVSVAYLIKENILMRKWSSHCVTIGPLLLLKEKWLDEDPEKISVLKYVATFKDRLFRAGQMAKRNLQESQSKMKVWYDRKAISRCFEPGDRVLVLFPVVGNPLQAKYSGPYKVVKKISDTNYLVKTPDRRKETQVCHINMLKAYHEKPKPELVTLNNRLGLESPTHSKDCVGQVNPISHTQNRRLYRSNWQCQVFSTFDMLKGYSQVPLTQRAREISAFVTPSGLYQYKVMPFGMKNAPATFQRMVNKLVRDIDGCEGFIDDVVIFSDNWSDHIRQIKRFFQIMREAKLTINLMKSEFGKATVKYLGHIVGQGQVRPLGAKFKPL